MVKLLRTLPLVACMLFVAAPAAAQATAPARFPFQIEMTVGFSGPENKHAQFPGFSAALALMYPLSPNVAVGGVAEAETSYARVTRAAGARVSRRAKSHTVFGQMLAGSATGGNSVAITSTGGALIQPGVGLRLGGRGFSFQFQIDYRFVDGGRVYNIAEGTSESQSGIRGMVGVSYRFGR